MQIQNAELVRGFIEATNAQRFESYDEFLAEELAAHMPGGRTLNRSELEDNERAFASAFPDIQRHLDDVVVEGDKVVARTSIRGTHQSAFSGIAPTGKVVETSAIVIYRIASGRIAEQWVEADFLGLMEQLKQGAC